MTWTSAALGLGAAVLLAALAISGGSGADPRTPAGPAGMPPPFLGTAVVGDGGLTAAVDVYGDLVDLRAEPAGTALIDNPAARQAAGTVDVRGGIVPRLRVGGGPALPLWRADSVRQSYLPGTNVVRTVARFGSGLEVTVTIAASGAGLALRVAVEGRGAGAEGAAAVPLVNVSADGVRCAREVRRGRLDLLCRVGRAAAAEPAAREEGTPGPGGAARRVTELFAAAAASDRRWLGGARALGARAPAWAATMYERSLLTLRALTGSRTGALAAGARDGWAYVWPRDAATAALAFAGAGYAAEARRVSRFLLGLDLEAAARFHGDGSPVPGRSAQGDAAGWVAVAASAAGLAGEARRAAGILSPAPWRNRTDYQEGEPGEYLGNAIASSGASGLVAPIGTDRPEARIAAEFGAPGGLARRAGDPDSGLDSAAAWAVRPFPLPALYPQARRTLRRLAAGRTRFGITPGEGWRGGGDPWTAPTAWTAWALAGLAADPLPPAGDRGNVEAPPQTLEAARRARAERRLALDLLADLRHAATPTGALPERVDAHTGVPRSTTPLAWTHAFAVLTLRELWPDG